MGMCERGMGSAVGPEPAVNEDHIWVMGIPSIPVLVKLTPNVADIIPLGMAAQRGGANGVSLINTIKSIIGIDIDNFVPQPVYLVTDQQMVDIVVLLFDPLHFT